jgi:hypothetical protein
LQLDITGTITANGENAVATNGVSEPPAAEALAEIRAVVARAKQGDVAALPRLRELLDAHPALWTRYGDLAAQAEAAWAALAAGADLHLRECLLHRAAALRAGLGGPAPSPVEHLLVERVVMCWLQLAYFDAIAAQEAAKSESSPRLSVYRGKRQAETQRMYLAAMAALVTLRRLLPARVQSLPTAEPAGGAKPEQNGHHANGHAGVLPDEILQRLSPELDVLLGRGQPAQEPCLAGAGT